MNQAVWSACRVFRFTIAVGLIVSAVSFFFDSHQARTAENTASFVPVDARRVLVPERTVIAAAIRNGLSEFAVPGDAVTAFVTTPVSFEDGIVIPPTAQLRGRFEKLSVGRANARVTINFTILVIEGCNFAIQTSPVAATIPVQGDIQNLVKALRALAGAGFGAAIGAATGDASLVTRGMVEGAVATLPRNTAVPVKVILIRSLELQCRFTATSQ